MPVLSPMSKTLSSIESTRLAALCLAFVGIDQVNDPLLNASLGQHVGYWLARVAALAAGVYGASALVHRVFTDRLSQAPWFWQVFVVTALGILPLVLVEVLLEPLLPLRPEFSDNDLRRASLALVFIAEYASIATILLPIHLLLWFVIPGRTPVPDTEGETSRGGTERIPGFLNSAGVQSFEQVIALKAEEHYVKVFTDSADRLVLQQFNGAVSAMPDDCGLQVHRSWWIADHAVVSAHRGGRRWRLVLSNQLRVPVSDSYLLAARARGVLDHERDL
ncbi:MAG: LytTR family DNA-binding domain-containing protein [Pseudomonadota bacterium]